MHPNHASSQKAKRPKARLKRIAVAVGVPVALIAAIQGAGTLYFSHHYVPGTTVNGIDASNLTDEELANAAAALRNSWSLSTNGDNVSLNITADGIGLTLDTDKLTTTARAAVNAVRWFPDLFNHNNITVDNITTIDDEKLISLVTEAVETTNETATDPTIARAAYDETADAFVVSNDGLGTKVDASLAAEKIKSDALLLKTSSELGKDQLLRPTLAHDSQELVSIIDSANKMLALQIPLNSAATGETIATVDRGLLKNWIAIVGDTPSELQIVIDTNAIESWADDNLAQKCAHSNEQYDWGIDSSALASSVTDAIRTVSADAIVIPEEVVDERPPESEGAAQQGRHVDVNLSTQYARFYDTNGSVIWRSYLVSGSVVEDRTTPTGTFELNNKLNDQELVGADEDKDGEPDYRSNVKYWMPFIGNSVGLHDASWRSYFGGSIYYRNGSHGCVNLPPSKAAELFDLIKVGDKIVVHN